MRRTMADISELRGKTATEVVNLDSEELVFHFDDATRYSFQHTQHCCEYVRIEDITGDLDDLVGVPLLLAEEETEEVEDAESATWTFYKFATIKGYVTVRWLGESNGYYSERVDLVREA